jgi:hypothetical protein
MQLTCRDSGSLQTSKSPPASEIVVGTESRLNRLPSICANHCSLLDDPCTARSAILNECNRLSEVCTLRKGIKSENPCSVIACLSSADCGVASGHGFDNQQPNCNYNYDGRRDYECFSHRQDLLFRPALRWLLFAE